MKEVFLINPHFQNRILAWYDQYGRKDLPWQKKVSPYRVWISEIMLQQTTVKTVIPYFKKFISRFPTLRPLARSPLDNVLGMWSGLGYYARARNLHRTANIILKEHRGLFPHTLDELQKLPGVGRSTAGAILSLGFNLRAPILDGNIKRVFARYYAIEGWPGLLEVTSQLWQLAEENTPATRVATYNQAMMDIGAVVCTRKNPHCGECPLKRSCLAFKRKNTDQFPSPKPSKKLPLKKKYFLILQNDAGEVLLERRPASGIWGGLWSFPECALSEDFRKICKSQYHCPVRSHRKLKPLRHFFTHFQLDITPILIKTVVKSKGKMENSALLWHTPQHLFEYGLPRPTQKLLKIL